MQLKTAILVAGLASASVLGVARGGLAVTLPLTVPAGYDLFLTPMGGTQARVDIAQGFFGTVQGISSDPFMGPIQLVGDPLGTFPAGVANQFSRFIIPDPFRELGQLVQHRVLDARFGGGPDPISLVDTIVQRLEDADLPDLGSSDTIPIEILALSLVSTEPVRVRYPTPMRPTFRLFDVSVDLADPQQMGSMALTRTGETSGMFSSTLPVNFRLTFTARDTGERFALTSAEALTAGNVPFIVPEPAAGVLLGAGLLGLGALLCGRWHRRR